MRPALFTKESSSFRIITARSPFAKLFKIFTKGERAVIILKDDDSLVKRAGRNIPHLSFLAYNRLRAHDLFYGRKVIMLESAAKNLSEFYGCKEAE